MLKKMSVALGVGLACALSLSAPVQADDEPWTRTEERDPETWFVYVNRIPTNIEEFRALRDELCVTPQGALVTFAVAGLIYDDNKDFGEQCMVVSVDASLLAETFRAMRAAQRPNQAVDGWQLGGSILQMIKSAGFQRAAGYTGKSYVVGSDRAKAYQLPAMPYQYIVRKHRNQPAEATNWKGFLNCEGASGPKPFEAKQNASGAWRLLGTSSWFAGTAPPPEAAPTGPR